MKTLVHLNEWTQLVLDMNIEEFEKIIENNHDKWANFVKVNCDEIIYNIKFEINKTEHNTKWCKFRLYLKRILFFYET